jgi:hypothetical protein
MVGCSAFFDFDALTFFAARRSQALTRERNRGGGKSHASNRP